MFDIGWSELLLIGVVALIVVGPRDLPGMFRTLGRFTARARGMAREFQRAMDDAAKEAGVQDVTKDLKDLTSKKKLGLDALEEAASKFEKWDPARPSAGKRGATATPAGKGAGEAEARAPAAAVSADAAPVAFDAAPAAAPAAPEPAAARPKPGRLRKPAAPKEPAAAKAPAAPRAAAKPRAPKAAPAAAPEPGARPAPRRTSARKPDA